MGLVRDLLHSREGPLLMGVLNCTPDSFSDGGSFLDSRVARDHARSMVGAGACVIDVGAESTRPGSARVPAAIQLERLGTIVKDLVELGAIVSVDTTDPEVAARTLEQGARIINCVDPEQTAELARLAHAHHADLVLMHSRGPMKPMPGFSSQAEDSYQDVVTEVCDELARARDVAVAAGLPFDAVSLDPGLGFHKNARHSLTLCTELRRLVALGSPVLVGPSRKSFLAELVASDGERAAPTERLGATIAACLLCVSQGAAMLRVHEVMPVRQALRFQQACQQRPALGSEFEEAHVRA